MTKQSIALSDCVAKTCPSSIHSNHLRGGSNLHHIFVYWYYVLIVIVNSKLLKHLSKALW